MQSTGYEFSSEIDLQRAEDMHRRVMGLNGLVKKTAGKARNNLLRVKLEKQRRRNGGHRWDLGQ